MQDEPFGQRLRAERERRRITLESIAARTKISMSLLRDLEADRMAHWPGGIFRRSFVKSYASAIGLDPDETLEQFLECYPDPQAVAGTDASSTMPRDVLRRRGAAPVLRLTLADEPQVFAGGVVLMDLRRRLLAAACDLGAPVVLAAIAYLITGTFWSALGITLLTYLGAGILALGNTPGIYLFAPGPKRPPTNGADVPPEDAGHLAIFEESVVR